MTRSSSRILRYASAQTLPLAQIDARIHEAEERAKRPVAKAPEPYTKSFGDFIAEVYPQFPFTGHTTRLVELGQRVFNAELTRALLMLPPRHYKSTVFSRFGPAYFLRRYPERTWGQGAHTQTLAQEFGQDARDYFVASGGILDPSSAGKGRWSVANALGGYWGAGVGLGTGLPAHFINVDDPIKNRDEAESAAYRRRLYNWWSSVLNTREEPGCIKLITHTRWATADLIGWLIKQVEELERSGDADAAEPWHVIEMPMLAEPIQTAVPATLTREPDEREPGEALDPERYDEEWARKKRLNTPDRDWAALYQQRPQPDGGTIFSAHMFRFWAPQGRPGEPDDAVLPDRFIRLFASVDCAFKDNPGADMVAMQLWGQTNEGLWLLDMKNDRMSFSTTLDTIKLLQPVWKFGELAIEDKANGPAIVDMLIQSAAGFIVHAITPDGGKTARANACTPQFTQGRVFFPRHHHLRDTLTAQLLEFPGGTYDDLVDATSQAINFVQGTGPMTVSTVHYGHGSGSMIGGDAEILPGMTAEQIKALQELHEHAARFDPGQWQ
jgi:predicted phage terminase large subunit-like protein